ncbi:MAG: UPF0146 family protein [Halobaculum sp.]
MTPSRRARVAAVLARYASVCEVGIGRRPEVAHRLADRGVAVTATDLRPRAVPESVRFVRDDLLAACERVSNDSGDGGGAGDPGEPYHADAVYALNCPPELHRPLATVAAAVDADALFTTLGGDQPTVAVERVPLRGGETLFVVDAD